MSQQDPAHPDRAATQAGALLAALPGVRRFVLHLGAMVALMYVGMMAVDPLYTRVARPFGSMYPATDWPVLSAVVMTAAMAIPMIPFMRWHGHSRRHIGEMVGAMASPSLVAVLLHLLGAVQAEALAGIGHAAMVPAMLASMLYRRGDYTSSPAA